MESCEAESSSSLEVCKQDSVGICQGCCEWHFCMGGSSVRNLRWFQLGDFCNSAFWWIPGGRRDLELEFFSYILGGPLRCYSSGLKDPLLCEHHHWLWHPGLAFPSPTSLSRRAVWEPRSYCPIVLAQPGKMPVLSSHPSLQPWERLEGLLMGTKRIHPVSQLEPGLFPVVAADRYQVHLESSRYGKPFFKQAEICFSVAFTHMP